MAVTIEHDFIRTIQRIIRLSPEEEIKLLRISSRKFIAKGDLFIRAGEVPGKLGFIHRGLFRYYYIDSKGRESTKSFFEEQSFITSYSAMIKGIGSYYAVEALEDSEVMVTGYSEWKELFEGYPEWNIFLIKLLEKGYIKKEAREREFLQCDAEERYRIFLNEYPRLENRVKQHLIASYLGITPVALSRIRKKMGRVNLG